jgi:ferric-dicitrate binding protein FerR (iron transport regulator)
MTTGGGMMYSDDEWLMLSRFFARECTPVEAARVEQWIAASPARQREVDVLRAAWECAATLPMQRPSGGAFERFAARAGIADLQGAKRESLRPTEPARNQSSFNATDISRKSASRRWHRPVALAAAAVIAVSASVTWRVLRSSALRHTETSERVVRTGAAERSALQLADGSQITLGPLSSLRIATAYGDRERSVELEGEARFIIVHDSKRPFVVRTANAIAEDLGTTFVVTTRSAEKTTEVAVLEGSVALRSNTDGAKRGVALVQGQLGRAEQSGFISVATNVDLEPYAARADGRLVFRKTSLSEVRRTLEQWYNIRIDVSDSALDQTPVSATFEGKSASEAVSSLARLLNVRIEQNGDVSRFVTDSRDR